MKKSPVSSQSYDEKYFLTDCGGYGLYKQSGGSLLDNRLQMILCLAFLEPGGVVLDVGCGRGELLAYCRRNNIRAWGIDYSESATRMSRSTVARNRGNNQHTVAISRADAKQLPFRTGSFDRIILSDIVEHLHSWELDVFLNECGRVLKSEGLVIIHTKPNRWYYTVRYPFKRFVARFRGVSLPKESRTDYEKEMHVYEHTYFSLKVALRKRFRSKIWFASSRVSVYRKLLRARRAWPFNCLLEDIWAVVCLKESRRNLNAYIEREMELPTALNMGGMEAYFLEGDWYSAEFPELPMRWTGQRASAFLNGTRAESVILRAICSRPDIETNQLSLAIRVNGRLAGDFKFDRKDMQTIRIPLAQKDRVARLRIDLEVDETWIPQKLNINDDPRELGVCVLSIEAGGEPPSGIQA